MPNAVTPTSVMRAARMRSISLAALGRAVPVQHPRRLVVAGLEEIGADRLMQRRVIDDERDVFACLFAGAFPARADFRAVRIAQMDTKVGRILGIGRFRRNEGEVVGEEERLNASDEAGFVAGEVTDLRHGNLLGWRVWKRINRWRRAIRSGRRRPRRSTTGPRARRSKRRGAGRNSDHPGCPGRWGS